MDEKYINIALIFKENCHFNFNEIINHIMCNLSINGKLKFFLLIFGKKYKYDFLTKKKFKIINLNRYVNIYKNGLYKKNKIFCLLKILKNVKNIDKIICINSNIVINTDLSKIYDKIQADKFLVISKSNGKNFLDFNFFGVNLNMMNKLNFVEDFEMFLRAEHQKNHNSKENLIFNKIICGKKYRNKIIKLSSDCNVVCDEKYIDLNAYKRTGYQYNLLRKTHNSPKIYHIIPFSLE